MNILHDFTDAAILEEMGRRLARLRLSRNWTQEELARTAGLSKRTVERLEGGQSVQLTNFVRAIKALGSAEDLNRLVPEVAPSPMAQLRLHRHEPQRASHHKAAPAVPDSWTWADET